jgi:hypothetical protein
MSEGSLAGWVPIRLYWRDGKPFVDWCRMDNKRFSEPFFDDTVGALMRLPFNLLIRHQTPVETLLDWATRQPGIAPTGFIFHMSRCGSTLISQMLAAAPRNIAISEAAPIDSVVRAQNDGRASESDRIAWLRAMVSALGKRRNGDEMRLFIKFDSWHILDFPIIRRAFPTAPWIFVYRDPVEVLVSQMRQRAASMLPAVMGSLLPGIDRREAILMKAEEYCARVLARICQAALDHHRDGGMLVNYRQLPDAVYGPVNRFFDANWTTDEAERMRVASQLSAKSPFVVFADDSAKKNTEATQQVRAMAATWVIPIYDQLEAARQRQRQFP